MAGTDRALGKPGKPVFIRDKEKPPLSPSEYKLIAALLLAGPDGLSKPEIESLKFGGYRNTLRRLREDPDWGAVILSPGKRGGCHALVFDIADS